MKYFQIEISKNGKIKKTKIAYPSWENQYYVSNGVMLGTHCSEENFNKARIRLIKKSLTEARNEFKLAEKKYNNLLNMLTPCQQH